MLGTSILLQIPNTACPKTWRHLLGDHGWIQNLVTLLHLIYRVVQKSEASAYFCLYLLNVSTKYNYFWHTTCPLFPYSLFFQPHWFTCLVLFLSLLNINTLFGFYPNVTTLRSVLCYCKSICLSSETLVYPTQGIEAFGNMFSPLCTLAILWPPCQMLRRSSQGNSSVGGVKRKRGIKIERLWAYRRLYLINGTR